MRQVHFIGGCNAEHVTANLPDVTRITSTYRIPTACMGETPFTVDYLLQTGNDPELPKRLAFETQRKYITALRETRHDVIVIDFWRDAYVPILEQPGGYLSVGWEITNDAELVSMIEDSGARQHSPGDAAYQAAFTAGLDLLQSLLDQHQPQAKILLLDCPPVQNSMRDGELQPLGAGFAAKAWADHYSTGYRRAFEAYRQRFPKALTYRFPEPAYSAPDAPWGEAALHYAPHFYAEAGTHCGVMLDQA